MVNTKQQICAWDENPFFIRALLLSRFSYQTIVITKEQQIMNTTYYLDRFISAQEQVYTTALKELQNGRKETHWMWYIFPQIVGLGQSEISKYYAIKDINEAKAYLEHSVLRNRLDECLNAILSCKTNNTVRIFGEIDSLKFHSSLTLFILADPENELFKETLEKYYQGITDFETENIIAKAKKLWH